MQAKCDYCSCKWFHDVGKISPGFFVLDEDSSTILMCDECNAMLIYDTVSHEIIDGFKHAPWKDKVIEIAQKIPIKTFQVRDKSNILDLMVDG